MPEWAVELAGALVPSLIVFGVAALLVLIVVWVVRRARRSPRARAAAGAIRDHAGASLVRLDDAVDELDLEVGLAGALYGGGTPASLRRARMSAQHVRDESFAEFAALGEAGVMPTEIRKGSQRIERRTAEAIAAIDRARSEHAEWMRANVSAAQHVTAARAHLDQLRATMGDPRALLADMAERFDRDEWAAAADAAAAAEAAVLETERLLAAAAAGADDPTSSILEDIAAAERTLRTADDEARVLEEVHRLVTQASQALPGEFDAARSAVRAAIATRSRLEPDAADRLGAEIRAVDAALDDLEQTAARRPTDTVDRIARLRDRLDMALGDASTTQQRLRGARTALPGTLAAARNVLLEAEASVAHTHAGADARSRVVAAQSELALSRQSVDPVEALDAARRAMRHAEDAKALAAYDSASRTA